MPSAFNKTLPSLFVAILLLCPAVRGQEPLPPPPSESVEERLGRLEQQNNRLEKQNRELLESLRQLQGLLSKQPQPTATPQPPATADAELPKELPPPPTDAAPGINAAAISEILQNSLPPQDNKLSRKEMEVFVNDWWAKKEQAKEEADDKKKREDEAAGFEVGKDVAFKSFWNHGLWHETTDKSFRIHVDGRAHFDTVFLNADPAVEYGNPGGVFPPIRDAFAFRRGRIGCEGSLWEVINFDTEWDFTNTTTSGSPASTSNTFNTPVPTDMWVEISKLPIIGHLRIGNQKPQIGFEHITSSRFLNFMERSFMFDAWMGGLNNGFVPGFQVWNYSRNERMTWSLGIYKNNSTVFGWNVGGGEYDCTGRVTALPIYLHEGRCLVHVGLGASVRDPDQGAVRQRARTALRNGPPSLHTALVDTTVFSSRQLVVVPEFAMVWGPLSISAEYFANWLADTNFRGGAGNVGNFVGAGAFPATGNIGTTFYHGAYVEALYFLTGEHRPYNKFGGSGAAFARVIPYRPFYCVPSEGRSLFSAGAWQVGARYQWIDLQDKNVPGGTLQDITLGLNWYLNPNLKFQWNYTLTHREFSGGAADGDIQGIGMRVAFDF